MTTSRIYITLPFGNRFSIEADSLDIPETDRLTIAGAVAGTIENLAGKKVTALPSGTQIMRAAVIGEATVKVQRFHRTFGEYLPKATQELAEQLTQSTTAHGGPFILQLHISDAPDNGENKWRDYLYLSGRIAAENT